MDVRMQCKERCSRRRVEDRRCDALERTDRRPLPLYGIHGA